MRVNIVNKARKDQGRCESCGEDIRAGDGYRYIKPRYGGKRKRHFTCPSWRPSEMTSSKASTAYAAQEAAHDALDALEHPTSGLEAAEVFVSDVETILNECAAGAEECRDDYQDGFDNMPENFQGGATGEEIQEKIDMLVSWTSELEGWSAPDVEADDLEAWADDVLESARGTIDSLEM